MTPASAPARRANLTWVGRAFPFLSCAALLLGVYAAHPTANAGFNDDWSYSDVALRLAQTGHIRYNGWGGATILSQCLWGAAWIRALGFSFDLLRFATLPFSLGFVLLVYALARKAGLTRDFAFFGTLLIATSPLFLPFAASFMTEPYACFFSTLCIYAALSSAEATGDTRIAGASLPNIRSNASATRWLWLLAAAGILGGSDRQTVWAAPLALIPYLFWTRRSDRRFAFHAAASFAVCVVSLILLTRAFAQPYGPAEVLGQQLGQMLLSHSAYAIVSFVSLLLSACLICWPALLCMAPRWKQLTPSGIVAWTAMSILFTAGFACLGSSLAEGSFLGIAPFAGNILAPAGILFAGMDAMGFRPDTVPLLLRLVLTCLLIFSVIAAAILCRNLPGKIPPAARAVFLIFSLTYLPFLAPGALMGSLYDRYLLPLFPVLVISALLLFKPQVPRIPASAWVCLLVFAAYSVATTHDYFSSLRARALAAETIERRGIPRNHISAGLEYDAWTQLQVSGHIKGVGGADTPNHPDTFWFWTHTTAIQPDYIALCAPASHPPAHGLLAIPYTDWFPPFQRVAVVLKRADLPK